MLLSPPKLSSKYAPKQNFIDVIAKIVKKLESLKHKNIDKVKTVCCNLAYDSDRPLLSANDKKKLKSCKSIKEIFRVMEPYWNWYSYRVLSIILKVVKPKAVKLLEKYEKDMYCNKNKLKEAKKVEKFGEDMHCYAKIDYNYDYFQSSNVPVPTGYTRIIANIDKDYAFEDFLELDRLVYIYLGIIQCPIKVDQSTSMEVTWLVSTEAVNNLCSQIHRFRAVLIHNSFVHLKINSIDILKEVCS